MHRYYAPLGATFVKWKSFSRNIQGMCEFVCERLTVCGGRAEGCCYLLLMAITTVGISNIAIIFALNTSNVLIRSPTQQLNLSISTNQWLTLAISYRLLIAPIFSHAIISQSVYMYMPHSVSVPLTTPNP